MPVIAIANQKGGVGKTTTTLNLGAALQEAGKRVLLIDLDPQGNLTVATGIGNPDDVGLTVGDLLLASAIKSGATAQTLRDAIVESPAGLEVVPSNSKLSAAELAMVSALSRELMLKSLLRSVRKQYDYILMDCLPSLGLVVVNALAAADGLVIPVQADYLAMQGLGQILETVGAVQERLNPDLEVYGILLTLVDQRTSHAREVVKTIRESFDGVIRVFETEVRLAVVLKDSIKAGVSILDYNSASESARAYRSLAAEVLAVDGESVGDLHAAAAARPRASRATVARTASARTMASPEPERSAPVAVPAEPVSASSSAGPEPVPSAQDVVRAEPLSATPPAPVALARSTGRAPGPPSDAASDSEQTAAAVESPHGRPAAEVGASRPVAPAVPHAEAASTRATPPAPASTEATRPAPGQVFRPRTLLTSIRSSATKLAQARALEMAERGKQATDGPAIESVATKPAGEPVKPAQLSEFLAGRPQWLGSNENPRP